MGGMREKFHVKYSDIYSQNVSRETFPYSIIGHSKSQTYPTTSNQQPTTIFHHLLLVLPSQS